MPDQVPTARQARATAGTAYINSEYCYAFLGEASLDARYNLLVPMRDLIDRRNDDPTIYLANEEDAPAYISALGNEVRVVPPSLSVRISASSGREFGNAIISKFGARKAP